MRGDPSLFHGFLFFPLFSFVPEGFFLVIFSRASLVITCPTDDQSMSFRTQKLAFVATPPPFFFLPRGATGLIPPPLCVPWFLSISPTQSGGR